MIQKKIFLFLIPLFLIPNLAYAQDTTNIDTYLTNLGSIFTTQTTVSAFYPVLFMILVFVFFGYALTHMADPISMVFSIGASILCIVLSLMFIAPIDFSMDQTVTTTEVLSDPNDQVFTSVKTTDTKITIIPNEPQFRFILSAIFGLFALLCGMYSIMVMSVLNRK